LMMSANARRISSPAFSWRCEGGRCRLMRIYVGPTGTLVKGSVPPKTD
jgi:hypothetical protein